MKIIIDTREQKPLKFPNHEVTFKKLDEGDYNIQELIPYIVIERKSLQDLYQSVTHDHARFKREILRSIEKGKIFYIFIEGTLEEFYFLNWSKRKIEISPTVLQKIIRTMTDRYKLIFIECSGRIDMSTQIVQTIREHRETFEKIKKQETEV